MHVYNLFPIAVLGNLYGMLHACNDLARRCSHSHCRDNALASIPWLQLDWEACQDMYILQLRAWSLALAKAAGTCVPKYGDGVHNFTAIACTGLSPRVVQLIYVIFQPEEI